MQAISVDDMSALDFAREYEEISDYFILDTSTSAVQGGTVVTYMIGMYQRRL